MVHVQVGCKVWLLDVYLYLSVRIDTATFLKIILLYIHCRCLETWQSRLRENYC